MTAKQRQEIFNRWLDGTTAPDDVKTLLEQIDSLSSALAPFADFADKWEAKPLRGIDDELYVIHAGEDRASFRLSDCWKAREALRGMKQEAN